MHEILIFSISSTAHKLSGSFAYTGQGLRVQRTRLASPLSLYGVPCHVADRYEYMSSPVSQKLRGVDDRRIRPEVSVYLLRVPLYSSSSSTYSSRPLSSRISRRRRPPFSSVSKMFMPKCQGAVTQLTYIGSYPPVGRPRLSTHEDLAGYRHWTWSSRSRTLSKKGCVQWHKAFDLAGWAGPTRYVLLFGLKPPSLQYHSVHVLIKTRLIAMSGQVWFSLVIHSAL